MKLGSKSRNVTIGVFALFAIALLLFGRMLWTSVGSSSASAAPRSTTESTPATRAAQSSTASAARRGHLKQAEKKNSKDVPPVTPSVDPRLKLGLLELAEKTDYAGTGRNIFEDQAEVVIPQPVKPAVITNAPPPGPPPPPPPPPINLKYFGFASKPGSPVRKAFLSNGDDVFVATEGDIVNRRYKILRINATSIEVQDVLSNNTQSIPLTQG